MSDLKPVVFPGIIPIFGQYQTSWIGDTLGINELHKLANDGDKVAEDRLFQYLFDSFLIFVQHKIWDKAEAEEIVQDTLMTISAKYKDMEFSTSFAAWAYRILENKLLSYYRTKTGRAEKIKQLTDEKQSSPEWVPNPSMQIKLKDCLQAVAKQSRRYARIINLSYQGFDSDEIGRRLDITRNNVYNILSRARRLLRHCLEKGEI